MAMPTAKQAAKLIAFRLVRVVIFFFLMMLVRGYLHAETSRGDAAMLRKDYSTAWSEYMESARQGDGDAQAAIGSMLFLKLNPINTGIYADCEKWLVASANQNNVHGETMLAKFYYADAVRMAGGINPGINTSPIPRQLQQNAERRFAQARQLFERAAAGGDGYAMGNLAIMLDAGVGGPRDPQRAAQLRSGVASHSDATFAAKATADPTYLSMAAAWQSGHYDDALQTAHQLADKGNAAGQATLGRAYYLGVGVARNYAYALYYVTRAVAQNNTDAMFILGLMYEHGRGVRQDFPHALQLFDRAASLGNRFAQMEAAGMRLQGESDRIAAEARRNGGSEDTACNTAGGIAGPGGCLKGGSTIDPWNPATY